ncbi:helix-turn-helix domain-containing protein [Nocardia sp. NPDC051832]|uniref:TetR/AcrR family transcriptional regulator n=1 Tax=Nocardia sp. NPDC051832 TaxID=3155673 RepID=UPI00343C5D97
MVSGWLRDERNDAAVERILDAAGQLFAERGVAETGMAEVARAAGCSRATVYRYFDNRQALRLAFVHRAARRLGAEVVEEVAEIDDPVERIIAAMLAAVHAVRAEPLLIAWFTPANAGFAGDIGQSSAVIEAMAGNFIGAHGSEPPPLARWITRVIVSLLTAPGRDAAEERAMLEEFVAPLLQGVPAT